MNWYYRLQIKYFLIETNKRARKIEINKERKNDNRKQNKTKQNKTGLGGGGRGGGVVGYQYTQSFLMPDTNPP